MLDIYKDIAHAVDKAKKGFDYLYMIALLMTVPDLIIQVYVSLMKLKSQVVLDHAHNFIVRYLYTIQNYMLLCSPAYAAGSVTSNVEELKLLLRDKLLQERDEDQAQPLEDFIDGHPLQFTVFKIIHLDCTLPITILNLCISYQIIVVQITNLY